MPFGELFPFRGFAKQIYDGSSTGVTTTHGVQVRSDYAAKYPEIVVAYLKATLEADRLYRGSPEEFSEKLAGWTGVDAEVYYAFHGPRGIQTRDYSPQARVRGGDPQGPRVAQGAEEGRRRKSTSTRYVNDRFIGRRQRVRLRLRRAPEDYEPLPFTDNAMTREAPVTDPNSAGADLGQGRAQGSAVQHGAGDLRGAEAAGGREGKRSRVVFVHDRLSGNKLFADKVWYVNDKGALSAFLLKPVSRVDWATKHGGTLVELRRGAQELSHLTWLSAGARRCRLLAHTTPRDGGATARVRPRRHARAPEATARRLRVARRSARVSIALWLGALAARFDSQVELLLSLRERPGSERSRGGIRRAVARRSSPRTSATACAAIFLGFSMAAVLAVGLGLLIGRFRLAAQSLLPPLEIMRPIPAVAWIPLAILLFASAEQSMVFITFIGAFFPILLSTVHGVEARRSPSGLRFTDPRSGAARRVS